MKIQATQDWQDTGFKPGAQSGAYAIIRASGEWFTRTDDRTFGRRDADGRTPNSGAQGLQWSRTEGNTNYPYSGKDGQSGQLIGKVGAEGTPFKVGSYCSIAHSEIDRNLSLFLRINDDNLSDNEGALDVEVTMGNGDTSKENLVVPGYRGSATGYKMANGQTTY